MPLKNVGRIVGGGTPKTNVIEYWKGGTIPWFTPADLGKVTGVYASDSERKITELGLAKSSAVLMPPNSILFSSRAPIGYIAVATKHCCTNQGCKSFVPDSKVVDSLWGYFAIRARTQDIIARASGTTFKEISGKGVGETLIPIPPLQEQQRIVKRLIEIKPFVDSYRMEQEVLEKLEQKLPNELKASLLQEAIQGKLVPQLKSEPEVETFSSEPDDPPFDIPDKWKWAKFRDVVDVRDGTHDTPKYQISGVPLVTSKNLRNGTIDFNNVKYISEEDHIEISKRSKVEKGDILFAMIGTVGNPAIVGNDSIFSIKNVALFKPLYDSKLNFEFLYYLLLFAQNQMIKESSGGVQRFVSLKYLRNFYIPVPPLGEQQRIVSRIKKLISTLEAL